MRSNFNALIALHRNYTISVTVMYFVLKFVLFHVLLVANNLLRIITMSKKYMLEPVKYIDPLHIRYCEYKLNLPL